MKTTAVTGQFGEPVRTLEDLQTAMASRAARAADKIRAKGLVASRLIGFAQIPRRHRDRRGYYTQRLIAHDIASSVK